MRPIVFPVFPSRLARVALLLWVGLEIGAFILVVHLVGPGGAVLAGVLTSLLGFSQLRRAGLAAVAKLRAGFGARAPGRGGEAGAPLLDETLGTLGGLCLLLPGFLSDIVGLALAVPVLRRWLGARLATWASRRVGRAARHGGPNRGGLDRGGGRHGPGAIDLDPGEWRHADAPRPAGWRDPDRTGPIPPP